MKWLLSTVTFPWRLVEWIVRLAVLIFEAITKKRDGK